MHRTSATSFDSPSLSLAVRSSLSSSPISIPNDSISSSAMPAVSGVAAAAIDPVYDLLYHATLRQETEGEMLEMMGEPK